jgi:hypothetical protein
MVMRGVFSHGRSNMVVRERSQVDRAERGTRRTLRIAQPESTAALRPSQRRAAQGRAALSERHSAEDWLRRLRRL